MYLNTNVAIMSMHVESIQAFYDKTIAIFILQLQFQLFANKLCLQATVL